LDGVTLNVSKQKFAFFFLKLASQKFGEALQVALVIAGGVAGCQTHMHQFREKVGAGLRK